MAAGPVTPSLSGTSAGDIAPGPVPLGGPVYIFLQVLGYGTVLGAIAVVVDALRRPASHFGGNSARRWMWAGPQLLLLVGIALAWLLSATAIGASLLATLVGFLALYLFFCLILQVAYLLVVVFPRHREPIPPEVDEELPREDDEPIE